MTKEIIENGTVVMFVSGYLSKLEHPYRMQKLSYASPTTVEKSEIYILDSSIGEDDVTNKEVLTRAEEIGADIVVSKDYAGEPERSLNSAIEMMTMIENRGLDIKVIVPIQSDSRGLSFWSTEVKRRVDNWGYEDRVYAYGIGGLKDASAAQQVAAARKVRRQLPHERLHFFGGGFSKTWIAAIREDPDLIDSMDTSTPIHMAVNGKLCLPEMDTVDVGNLRGKHSTIRVARIAELSILNWYYATSRFVRTEDIEERL